MSSYAQELQSTVQAMMTDGKGILAMDESKGTCDRRFEKLNIPTTEERRRTYRELILTTPHLADFISSAILFDETIRQSTQAGVPFVKFMQNIGIIPGIKLDLGAKDLAACPGEKVTEGLDGLRDRIAEYYQIGARFAKWRAVITIDTDTPSETCLVANAHALARYAALCQEGGLVPIVETEVLIDGNHTIDRCYEVTERTLQVTFDQLKLNRVDLERIILKPSMVLSGANCSEQASVEKVVEMTVRCLQNNVPDAVPGIAFLSGGQSIERATAHLNLINAQYAAQCPWTVTFSYARAIQQPALDYWHGDDANIPTAQQLLLHRAKLNSAACQGKYTPEME
ncbi:class I fructose-bisphosphate aldolase [Chamaesiphon sp. OTE_8_metabat_110]|uniref:class I fructose-bisphosphate aldolase n=1 Tax=Chamaesiphon sp. OTE_8_metabat_110 TaxID=2964696 RepID=UPI00286BD35F|nr:class I fructose-bisphosphate aldolase [Chamaesiphon sp. OTE_8_metabat_110]